MNWSSQLTKQDIRRIWDEIFPNTFVDWSKSDWYTVKRNPLRDDDQDPSFRLNLDTGGWIDHGTGKNGDTPKRGDTPTLLSIHYGLRIDSPEMAQVVERIIGRPLDRGNGNAQKSTRPPQAQQAAPRPAAPPARQTGTPTGAPATPTPIGQADPAPAAPPANLPTEIWIDELGKKLPVTRWFGYDGGLYIARCEYGPVLENGKRKKACRPWYRGKLSAPEDVPLHLYHESNLQGAKKIRIVEGEPKAEKYEEAGLVSTTAPRCKWSPKTHRIFARRLLDAIAPDAEIILDADNDVAGKTYVHEWRDAINAEGFTGTLKISYTLPGVGEKGDIVDFSKLFQDGWEKVVEEYHDSLEPWHPPEPEIPPHLKINTLADVPEEDEPIISIVDGFIPENGLVFFFSEPAQYKTWMLLHMAMHVAAGRQWIGRDVIRSKVLWIDEESGRKRINHRLRLLRRGEGFENDGQFGYTVFAGFNLGSKDSFILLRQAIEKHQAKLIVIDTLASVTPGVKENDTETMGQIAIELRRICEEINCSIVVIHHSGKDPDKGMRGTSALTGKADAIVRVDAEPGKGIISLVVTKDRDGTAKPFTAEFFLLPDTGDGKPGVRIIPANKPKTEIKLTRPERFVMDYMRKHPGRDITIREMADNADTCSGSSVKTAVYGLVEKGLIEQARKESGRGGQSYFRIIAENERKNDPE